MLMYVIVFFVASFITLIAIFWRRSWFRNLRISLPIDDELYSSPAGINFLPEKLHYGAEVIHKNVTYVVYGTTVATIGGERWLLYHLDPSESSQEAVLGVSMSGRELHVRWWEKDANYPKKEVKNLLASSTTKTKYDDKSYLRSAYGYERFVSLGSMKYPLNKHFTYALFQGSVHPTETSIGYRWLLALQWQESGRNLLPETHQDLLVGVDIDAEDITAHSPDGYACLGNEESTSLHKMGFEEAAKAIKVQNYIGLATMFAVMTAITAVFIF